MKEWIWEDSDDGYVSTRKQELVRCKDCKHWVGNWVEYNYSPTAKCTLFHYPQPADWFCADGERKSD